MTSLIAAENDYRALMGMPDVDDVGASVIIPVFNRVELLNNVLAGLSAQETQSPFEVIVVDDGSEEDVASVVQDWKDSLDVRLLRQDHDGRGAGRARNAGTSSASNEVLLFLDADCIPSPQFVEGHVAMHRRVDNIVVSASRHHIDTEVSVDEVVASFSDLRARASGADEPEQGGGSPDDWRQLFYRRTQRLQIGDGAYRAVLSGLMSVRKDRFEEVGGFDEAFRTWGGEDTELGWRLWNSGCFIVPADEISVLHQTYLDSESGVGGRKESRTKILPLVADRVPHRFYRKYPSASYSVPKVSWIVIASSVASLENTRRRIGGDIVDDAEVVIVASGDTADRYRAMTNAADRVSVVESFSDAVHATVGEILVVVADTAAVPRSLVSRCLALVDQPRSALVRVGYKSEGTRWTSTQAIHELDVEINGGIPMFAVVKRRDLMMDRNALADPSESFAALHARARSHLVVTDLVTIPSVDGRPNRKPTVSDLRSVGVPELTRAARRALRTGASEGGADRVESAGDDRPLISYVGFTGNANLGDEVMLLAARELMPWARVEPNAENADLVLLGGGTLLNADGYYLERVRRVDHPNALRAVLGTGVRSFDYWKETESLDSWRPFLETCELIGVRGPDSLDSLRKWGWEGRASTVGDLAFGLHQREVEHVDSAVFCPMWVSGDLIGGSDERVVKAFCEAIKVAESEGLAPILLASHPTDDRAIVRIANELGNADFSYVDGYHDVESAIATVASASVVVSERLHGSIIASAMGTPFVAVEYRPKVRDFVNSVGAAEWCVRSDEPGELASLVKRRLQVEETAENATEEIRRQLMTAAAQLASSLDVSTPT